MSEKPSLEIRPSLQEIEEGRRPGIISTVTMHDGGIGPGKKLVHTVIWRVKRDTEEIFFESGAYHDGLQALPLMPWHVPESHLKAINRVGRALFGRSRFRRTRLYGKRAENRRIRVFLVTYADGLGEQHSRLFATQEGVDLWKALLAVEDASVVITDVTAVSPRQASRRLGLIRSETVALDRARENDLRVMHELFMLDYAVRQGEDAKRRLEATGISPADVRRARETIGRGLNE